MKMYNNFIATLVVAMITSSSYAGNINGGKDPLEVTYIKNIKGLPDAVYQEQLRKSLPWQKFLQHHSDWNVEFNESTQKPHRAFGIPISTIGNNPVDAVSNFMETNLSVWNLPVQDLKFQSQNFSGKYYNVFYSQTYHGLDVINSQVFVKLTRDFRVNTWGMDVFDLNISTVPVLSKTIAVDKAEIGMTDQVTSVTTPELKILPIPDGRLIVAHLVYEVVIKTKNESNAPGNYYTLVDANSGEVLYRQNKTRFAMPLNSDINVSATVYEYRPGIAPVSLPLRNLKVVSGSNTSYTDSIGNVSLTGVNPINAKFTLEGLWSKTVTDQGSISDSLLQSLPSGSDSASFDSVSTIRHTSGYFHVNNIHDFMKRFFPTFTDLDFPLPTRIDVTGGTCNAFYSGTDINFYATGGGCNCMSQIGDVVYHEYGHGINDRYYSTHGHNFANSAMGEGYADVWAISLTENPVLGRGESISNLNSYIRRYDINRKVYPQDIHGEPHDDGEIIAGAWYDVSLNLNSWAMMTDLFSRTFNDFVTGPDGDEGQVYSDILLAALTEDDDDANLMNGTPHDQAILDAFALHGIRLINNATFSHDPVLAAVSNQPIKVSASLITLIPFLPTYLELHYRIDNVSPYSILPMTLDTGVTYSTFIPQQQAGTIVSYFIKLIDSTSTLSKTQPQEADTVVPNIPYFIIVDCVRGKIEDFDANQSAGWLTGIPGDDATGGLWIIAAPVPSFKSGDTCQTGVQHTTGGVNCAVTGNAASPSFPNYNADVDGGKTTLQSPAFDLSGYTDPIISYWRWYTNDQGSDPRADYWQTYISGDGINFTPVENIIVPDHSWRRFAFRVSDYVPGATSVTLRFVGDDEGVGSVVEAAVDDIEIYSNQILGINNPSNENSLSIYPNPASDILTLDMRLTKTSKITYEVVNNLGQTVISSELELSAGNNISKIDVQKLENGIYYFVVKNGDERVKKTFSILR